ncbi:cysteine-rich CWC family protein [Paenibacillus sp. P25]|nr:cysteine-rich CWC family protein [Paenibacillus sp. P25]
MRGDNGCGNLAGKPHGTCWCSRETFPEEIFAALPQDRLGLACICRGCLERFKSSGTAQ